MRYRVNNSFKSLIVDEHTEISSLGARLVYGNSFSSCCDMKLNKGI